MKKQIIIEIISILHITLFIYAAVSKLADVEKFRAQLGQSPLITAFSYWLAVIVPITEILISITLAIPRTRIFGLYCSFTIMTLFTAYIIAITQFSEYVPCSCGGVLQNLGWTEHLFFNIAFVLMAGSAIIINTQDTKSHIQKPQTQLS